MIYKFTIYKGSGFAANSQKYSYIAVNQQRVQMKKLVMLLLAVVALSSCSAAIKYVSLEPLYNEQWMVRSHADIVSEYGAPDRMESDGLDGSILVYETYTENMDKEFTHFFIGSDSRCYMVKTNQVEADPDSVKRSKRVFWTSYGLGVGALVLLFIGLVV